MDEQPAPPGPWQWREVTPESEDRVYGEALVAHDGTWVIWSEGGYGAPDVHPAAKALLTRAWELGVPAAELPGRDHDHTAEDAVLAAFEHRTAENQHAAELAVALLQRRHDHVLRRLDGTGDVPPYPTHRHNAAEHPADCLGAVLHELAGGLLDDRAETLGHGLSAARALEQQVGEARHWARWCYRALSAGTRIALGEVPTWLLEEGDE